MQQIIYDIIDNCFNHYKNNIAENNSANSDITITPPQSTKGGSNNNNMITQTEIKNENKKILFNVLKNFNINIINNNENNNIININIKKNKNNKNIFISKKRKRVFSIQKIQKKNNKSTEKIFKKINIFKQNFQLPKLPNEKKDEKFVIDILINKNKNNNNKWNNTNINILNNKNITNDKNNNNIPNDKNNNNIVSEKKEEINDKDKEKNINIEEEKNKDNNNNSKKKKRKSKATNEKELQILYEQKFLENMNKEYPDEEYEKDMKECLNNKKMKFMKENFPMMFQKDKFYLYNILPKKRLASKEYYIEPNYFNITHCENLYNYYDLLYSDYNISFKNNNENSGFNDDNIKENINNNIINKNILINNLYKNKILKFNKINNYINNSDNKQNNKIKIFNIVKIKKIKKINKNNLIPEKSKNKIKDNYNLVNNSDLIINEKFSYFPKKVWSLNDKNINVENFFDDCIQIWPFDECCFIKEIALEFLMKNNYSISICLEKIKEFVYYMKKRANELDFPIISESIKTIKKYNLRKTNYN